MDDYKKGFLEALQAVCIMGDGVWHAHFKNAQNESLSEEYQKSALDSAMSLGNFISSVKCLATQVHRDQSDPKKIATANGEPFWWATEDGKGRS